MSDAPKLIADFENGEGSIRVPAEFNEYSAITRADILKDWIHDLAVEYNLALSQLFNPPATP